MFFFKGMNQQNTASAFKVKAQVSDSKTLTKSWEKLSQMTELLTDTTRGRQHACFSGWSCDDRQTFCRLSTCLSSCVSDVNVAVFYAADVISSRTERGVERKLTVRVVVSRQRRCTGPGTGVCNRESRSRGHTDAKMATKYTNIMI